MSRHRRSALALPVVPLLVALAISRVAAGQEAVIAATQKAVDDAALAKELQNPVADLLTVPLENRFDVGSDGLQRFILMAQPVLPFELSKDVIVVSRTLVPLVCSSGQGDGGQSITGLGDATQSFFFAPKAPVNGWIFGGGPLLRVPTATSSQLGERVWGAGPTVVVLRQDDAWTYGLLLSHTWSFASRGDTSVNSSHVEPFLAFTTPTVTTFSLGSEADYDWLADKWTLPLDLAVSQLVRIGGSPVSFTAGWRSYLDRPSGGPNWAVKAAVTLMFAK